jgi:hypothetical protein
MAVNSTKSFSNGFVEKPRMNRNPWLPDNDFALLDHAALLDTAARDG